MIVNKNADDGDGKDWIHVAPSKSRNSRKVRNCQAVDNGPMTNTDEQLHSKELVLEKLKTSTTKMMGSDYFDNLKLELYKAVRTISEMAPNSSRTVRKIGKIICFSLGSFVSARQSLDQLALLNCLYKTFNCRVELYDPVFTNLDKAIIDSLNFHMLENDCFGKYDIDAGEVKSVTIFYMPHHPHGLLNNLLYHNWQPDKLSNCLIIGNGYTSAKAWLLKYSEFRESTTYIRRAIQIANIKEIEDSHDIPKTFNDFGFITFPKQCFEHTICNRTKKFWKRIEPKKFMPG